MGDIMVMISGGFAMAYEAVLPAFRAATGIGVTTLSGASQGQGPRTIRYQLEHGAEVDVVILSNEGLQELREGGWVREGSAVELATAPLAAAVRVGAARPDVGTVVGLRASLLAAGMVVMPGSTSGLFIRNEVLPQLGIAEAVRYKVVARGTESAACLAAGEADLALGPVSELVNVPGIEVVGLLPDAVQLVQVFSAAILRGARAVEEAGRLVAFLASERAVAAIRRAGMAPVGGMS